MRGMSKKRDAVAAGAGRRAARAMSSRRRPSRSATPSRRQPEDGLGLPPRRAGCGHVAADDEGQLVLRCARHAVPSGYRPCTTRPPRSISTSRDRDVAAASADGEAAQLEPDCRAGVGLGLLVRRLGDRHQHDAVEPELVAAPPGPHEVAEVRRVERPAEDPDLSHGAGRGRRSERVPDGRAARERRRQGRMWPSPWTTYLNVHSSRSAIGPRAWSFWVELPISAPIPNSPPSVKRVEALM